MDKLAFVTGGAGFLGAQLCRLLIENNFSVVCFGRSSFDALPEFSKKLLESVHYHQLDLRDDEIGVRTIISEYVTKKKSFDELYLFNLAWSGESGLSDLCIARQFQNVAFTLSLYEIAADLNFHCFVHSGTMEEKFAQRYTSLDFRKDELYNRHVIYALAKLYSRYSLKVNRRSDTRLVINSNAHLIGPGDKKDSFLQQVIISHLQRQDIRMSSGLQLFDVINVRDCAEAYLLTARESRSFDEFWIGSNSPRKLIDYVHEINFLLDKSVKIFRSAIPYNDVILESSDFDASKLFKLGFELKYDFSDSVKELSAYLSNL